MPSPGVGRMSRGSDAGGVTVTVVVPARNAMATLPALLAALDRQTFDGSWDVVLVDDASTDATAEVAERWGARVVRLDRQSGPAHARNAGVAATRAPRVAFTDADCEPTPRWLARITAALDDADLAMGPVRPLPGVPVGPFDRTLHVRSESPLFETANLAIRRELAERVGGFEPFAARAAPGLRPAIDEGHFGEDAVFGWRARRLGARIVFEPAALVHHAVFPRGVGDYLRERWRLRFFPALVREVPELRPRLTLRFFLAEHTVLFDVALASLAVAGTTHRRLPVLGTTPYLARRLVWRGAWRRSVAGRNVAVVAGDAIGLVALVRGSVAARRLLL